MDFQPPKPETSTVMLNGVPVSYTVRRSPRARNMRITISAQSGVVITLPARLNRYVNPEDFLREKQDWVLRNLQEVKPARPAAQIRDGSKIYYRGQPLRLRVNRDVGKRPHFTVEDGQLHLNLPPNHDCTIRETLRELLQSEAATALYRDVRQEATRMGLVNKYGNVTIRDQKTKWGSCSKQGNISLNWRLILFPEEVRRYIVIHELCHLQHFDHSPKFWSLVEHFDPDFRTSVAWLKKHAARYERDLR
ncbi:MAG: M48 family metallopeptidase [Chlorobi bacterium]|nr:M48 family metallopeptidase [Chlorobiota bacterium]